MDNAKAIGGGIAGGAACFVLWSLIAFFGGAELGIFAIVVGVAVGIGVRQFAKPSVGVDYGVLAVLIAAATILIGKLSSTALVTEAHKQRVLAQTIEFTDDQMLVREAIPFAKKRIRTGTPMQWKNGKSMQTATSIADFPPEVVEEATAKWNKIVDKEGAKLSAVTTERSVRFGEATALRRNALAESFSLLNLLWIVVALPAAFFLGAGKLSFAKDGEELDGGDIGDAKWDGDTLKAADGP